jgi:Domain of unknown function (DUF5122) beta-propeller
MGPAAILLDSQDRPLYVGKNQLIRYMPDGTADSTFDATSNTWPDSTPQWNAATLDADGRLVTAGSSTPDGFSFGRFTTQPTVIP